MSGGAVLGAWDNSLGRDHRGYNSAAATAYIARITGDYPDYTLTDGGEKGARYFTPPASIGGAGKGITFTETKGYGYWAPLLMLTNVYINRNAEENVEGGYAGIRPELLANFDYNTVDGTLQPVIEKEKCANDGKPTLLGQVYLQTQATDASNYQRLIYPIVEMIADHTGEDSIHSTAVYGTYDGGLDRRINAGMHTFWWVKQRENSKWNIAWNQRESDQDDTGYGFECHLGDAEGTPTILNESTENPSDIIEGTAADEREDHTTLAYCSWLKYGHHHPGHSKNDKHKYGENSDGESINANHIWMKSFFYYNQQLDAPLDYEPVYNPRPGPLPNRVRVHFQTDPDRKHDFELGARQDIHYWWAEAVFDPPTWTPPTRINGVPPEEPIDTGYVPVSVDDTNVYETSRGGKYTTSHQRNTKRVLKIKEANSPFQIGSPGFVARAETKTQDGQEYGGEWGPTENKETSYETWDPKEYEYGTPIGRIPENSGYNHIYPLAQEEVKEQKYVLSPIIAHMNFIGKIDAQKEWGYSEQTENSNFDGGTANGGVWITPPEFTYKVPDSGTYSDTFFGFHHSMSFGWGAVDNDNINNDGAIFSLSGSSGSYDLNLDFYNATPASSAGVFNVNGYISATEVGGAGGFWLPDDTQIGFGNTAATPDASIYWQSANNRLRMTADRIYVDETQTSTIASYNLQEAIFRINPGANTARQYFAGKDTLFLHSVNNYTSFSGARYIAAHNYSTGTVSNLFGLFNQAYNVSSGQVNLLVAGDYDARSTQSGTAITMIAGQFKAYAQHSADVTIGYGLKILGGNYGTGNYTQYNGIRLMTPVNVGGGALGTAVQLYIEDGTAAGTNYAIYVAGGECLFNASGNQVDFGINSDTVTILKVDGTNNLIAFGDTGGANYMTINDTGKLQPFGTANYLSTTGNPGITENGTDVQQYDLTVENGLIVAFTEKEAVSDVRVINANQTMLITDQIVECTNAITYTLLAVAAAGVGKVVTIKNFDSVNSMTVTGNGVETIDDDLSQTLAPYEALKIYANSTKWGSI